MDNKLDLVTRLSSYIARMAPHQKEREGGKLLIEALEELKFIRDILDVVNKHQFRGLGICEVISEDE